MNGKEAIERAIDAIKTEMVKIKTPEDGEMFGPGLWRALAAVSLGALTGPILSGATPLDSEKKSLGVALRDDREAEIRADERSKREALTAKFVDEIRASERDRIAGDLSELIRQANPADVEWSRGWHTAMGLALRTAQGLK